MSTTQHPIKRFIVVKSSQLDEESIFQHLTRNGTTDVFVYGNPDLDLKVLCSFNRSTLSMSIKGIKKGLCQFTWLNLHINNFEEIHGFSRILGLIPDKIATAITINSEYHCGLHSGSYLIRLVVNLLIKYSRDEIQQRCPPVVQSIQSLKSRLELLEGSLDAWNKLEIYHLANLIIDQIDLLYAACYLYIEFGHKEIVRIGKYDPNHLVDKGEELELAVGVFLPVANTLQNKDSLQKEFYDLLSQMDMPK